MTNFNDLLYPNDNSRVSVMIHRHAVDSLFNRLLVAEGENRILRNMMERFEPDLLKQLWPLCSDRFKNEALYDQPFRSTLDKNGISYEDDLKRLDIPVTLSNE
jgi:hypothetical protein